MQQRFLQQDKYYYLTGNVTHVHETLPGKNYIVHYRVDTNTFYLESIRPFTIPEKVYGDAIYLRDRIIKSYKERLTDNVGTGAMFSGSKGSGKSLLVKMICNELTEKENYSVVALDDVADINVSKLVIFLQNLPDNCIILFEEFDKVFENRSDQNTLLSLLDGIHDSNKLVLATLNYLSHVNDTFINRPGRFFYSINFDKLEEETIKIYLNDYKIPEPFYTNIINYSHTFDVFNFDMLQGLVEEILRYPDQSFDKIIKYLNIKPQFNDKNYVVKFIVNNKKFIEAESRNFNILEFKQYYLYISDYEITSEHATQRAYRYGCQPITENDLQDMRNIGKVIGDSDLDFKFIKEDFKCYDKNKRSFIYEKVVNEDYTIQLHFEPKEIDTFNIMDTIR